MRELALTKPDLRSSERERTLAGEPFELWVHRSRDTLYATLLRILRNESEAEDLLQDTYLRALSRLHSFRGEGDPVGWLRRIAVRLALNHLRRKSLLRWIPFAESGEQPVAEVSSRGAEHRQRRERLEELLRRESSRSRVAFSLRVLDDRPYAEIAELLSCSEASVRSIVSRTRLRLEEEIRKRGWNDD
ncbi:MAG: RNA polymerase sigma factor [Candidatus Krumholzibacteria bacterium]|jgi:RNA polymerase sigma-70 factor (ECF subfamily)|nr:RNA polymerase sigma factor [Candidatus Krumholzibacteria bacterium]MDP6668405.1 RNA polymerase sigma factor [Candidatus Krumholzibacteria bacterium]MDP6797974.1 RNA polymerase sigma factor [Candidatus Krumholzibacteria bacterium]MDP7021871.1 RNA polymerase sigma factor [Candidatus Krumholzibacteria bacterium]